MPGKRDAVGLHAERLHHERETRALTPIIRPFVFIRLSTRRVPAAEARQGIVIPQGFMGNPGASSSPARDGGDAGGGVKLKMSIKSIKSEAQGRLPWNILRQRGNSFSYAISISCFASSPRPSPRSPPSASLRSQPPTSDLYAFHPLKPLTPPDIKGNAN